MKKKTSDNNKLFKIAVLVLLLTMCLMLTYYFHFILKVEVLFTHIFYVPIFLAGLWWSRKGIAVAVFLALMLLFSNILSPLETITWEDGVRSIMFVIIGIIAAILNEKRQILENKLRVKSKTLEQANIQLKELDHLKSMFLASMSHELRTPLNSIIGFTGMILMGMTGEITEEQRKQLTMVKNSANHLLALINDVIDVSKIESGKVELLIEEFDLSSLLQELKDSLTVAADKKDLKMSIKMPERLVIKSDERRVKQIIMNFMSNAVKFTDEGEIEIKAMKKDRMVDISVRDTGIGMRKEDMVRLFGAFIQIPAEGRTEEGTGLGLHLSKKIANLLGGEILLESEFGRGSKFTFTLPLVYKEV